MFADGRPSGARPERKRRRHLRGGEAGGRGGRGDAGGQDEVGAGPEDREAGDAVGRAADDPVAHVHRVRGGAEEGALRGGAAAPAASGPGVPAVRRALQGAEVSVGRGGQGGGLPPVRRRRRPPLLRRLPQDLLRHLRGAQLRREGLGGGHRGGR
eukprot:845726-Prorocentrum_minimum.AAC.2